MAEQEYRSGIAQEKICTWDDIWGCHNTFNRIMRAHGCPVRVDPESRDISGMVAAWDWLATKVQQVESRLDKLESGGSQINASIVSKD